MDALERSHAIGATRKHINRSIQNCFLETGPDWLKYWSEFGFGFATEETPYLTMRAESVDDFCLAARKNGEAFRLFKEFVGGHMKHGKEIPKAMSKLVGEYLLTGRQPIGHGSGRPKNWGRDIIIILAMQDLLQTYDLKATRRKVLSTKQNWINKRTDTASELVQLALKETEIGYLELARIQRIWGNKKMQMARNAYWGQIVTVEFDEAPETHRI
jgi:hypothetical protein